MMDQSPPVTIIPRLCLALALGGLCACLGHVGAFALAEGIGHTLLHFTPQTVNTLYLGGEAMGAAAAVLVWLTARGVWNLRGRVLLASAICLSWGAVLQLLKLQCGGDAAIGTALLGNLMFWTIAAARTLQRRAQRTNPA